MAAAYRLVISTVNCYNSVTIDQRFQHTVHYCNGSCQALKNATGIDCSVAHHGVCSELLSPPAFPTCSLRLSGTPDLNHKLSTTESIAASSDIASEDCQQFLPGSTRVKKGQVTPGLSNLKDITGDAINLASGKTKEFSFEKMKCPSSHVSFRKGRKVKPDVASRKSADFDIINNHIGSDENCPPFGFAQKSAVEEKGTNLSILHEHNISNAAPLYLQNFLEENLIAKILEKIKVCLDILLKCSEDLKKCTEIIKQCIKSKALGNVDRDASNNPDIIYKNVMARLSSYLKKLPFELEHGLSGHSNQHDLTELVNSLHNLQQMPYTPFGNDQPPRYEDVVQSSTSINLPLPPMEIQKIHKDTSGKSTRPLDSAPGLPCNGSLQNNGIQQKNTIAVNHPSALPHLISSNYTDSCSSEDKLLSKRSDIISKVPMEPLYIQEDCDIDKLLGQDSKGKGHFGLSQLNLDKQTSSEVCKGTGEIGVPITNNLGQKRTHVETMSDSPNVSANLKRVYNFTDPSKVTPKNDKDIQQEDIEKLLMELESFSQTIEDGQKYNSSRGNDVDLKNCSPQTEHHLLAPDSGSNHLDATLRESVALSPNVSKGDEDDGALLLRILESIEGFAQELVERGSNKDILAREKEVMWILQDTLKQTTESCKTAEPTQTVVAKDTGSHLSVQQIPEVIKVQSNKEKKPGTPPPAVTNTAPSPLPPSNKVVVSTPASVNIPRFYFPKGLPNANNDHDETVIKIEAAFSEFEDENADIYEMGKIAKACGCPLYWKAPMFISAGGERTGCASVHSFVATWRKVLQTCHDDASRFVYLLAKPSCNYLEQEDFIPLLQDIVDTHPGLTFLKDAPEFHSRYITTVIQRIFYTVNRSWSGKITLTELRKSNFLQTLALLEEEDDINQITDYFSYEHFYVIYCKFWELDTDHDLFVDQKDLARHNDHAISNRIIERIFSGAVTRGNSVQKDGRMSYADFVWFLVSEEDKKNATSMEYWFRAMDIDGDGVLSMYELEYFYEEQCERMEGMGIEPLPFHDLLCQMLDLVKPECEGKITLRDLKRCRMAHIFYDTCFNLEKYLDHEQRDPFAVQKDIESDSPEPSDWDKYAAEEYEILVAEESANEQLQEGGVARSASQSCVLPEKFAK
uniref:Protein phosphatase 2 regulatory subunit B''alpha n=1 Tax=Callorhinchus milii TaxID=7868 RepID=A0A4W3JAV3_CALMI